MTKNEKIELFFSNYKNIYDVIILLYLIPFIKITKFVNVYYKASNTV